MYICIGDSPGIGVAKIAAITEKSHRAVGDQVLWGVQNGLYTRTNKQIYLK